VLDGAYQTLDIGQANALMSLKKSRGLALRDLEITRSIANRVTLEGCAGAVSDCTITAALMAGLHSLDAAGLQILHNRVADCANNGIQIWRSEAVRVRVRRRLLPHRQQHDLGRDGGEHPRHEPGDAADRS
jgi:hypothetical protein